MIRFVFALGWVASLLSGGTARANAVISVQFEELPALIHQKNRNIPASERMVESAEARTGHLVRSFIPTLRADIGGEAFQTGSYPVRSEPYASAEVRLNVYRGGRDSLEQDARLAQLEGVRSSSKQIFRDELEEARVLFWELVHTRERIARLKGAVEQNEEILKLANRRILRGLSTDTDRIEFEIHRSQLIEELESLQHGLLILELRFGSLLGSPADTRFTTLERIPHVHDEALLQSEFEPLGHPSVVALTAGSSVADAQKSQASRWWLPSLDLYAGNYLYTLRDRDYLSLGVRDDQVVGVRLSFDILDGFQAQAQARALALQVSALELQTEQRKYAIRGEFEVTRESLKHDHELIHRSEERMRQGQESLKRTRGEYERGVKTSLEALAVLQRQIQFERQDAERRRDYQVTQMRLLALLGK